MNGMMMFSLGDHRMWLSVAGVLLSTKLKELNRDEPFNSSASVAR